jgi:hypothetical protein
LIIRQASQPTRLAAIDQDNESRKLSHLKAGRNLRLALSIYFLHLIASNLELINHRLHFLTWTTAWQVEVQEHGLGSARQCEADESKETSYEHITRQDHRIPPWIPSGLAGCQTQYRSDSVRFLAKFLLRKTRKLSEQIRFFGSLGWEPRERGGNSLRNS